MKAIRTPFGYTAPVWLFAVIVAGAITLGSALGMAPLGIPWWGWIIEFAILMVPTYYFAQKRPAVDA